MAGTETWPPLQAEGRRAGTAARSTTAEGRMVHRVLIATLIVIPVCVVFFSTLVFIATRIAGVPSGAPTLMGAAVGVLSGVFFGMWAGVVASVSDVEHIDLAPVPEARRERADEPNDEGGDAACWAHDVCAECGRIASEGHASDCASATTSTPSSSDAHSRH